MCLLELKELSKELGLPGFNIINGEPWLEEGPPCSRTGIAKRLRSILLPDVAA